MSEFKKENLENIKNFFEEKTGVELPRRKAVRRSAKIVIALAAVIACLSITAFAGVQFSSLDGDELALDAKYEGEGIVTISVENRSDKLLEFDEKFYLRRWSGDTVAVDMSAVRFENTSFAPNSSGVMRIDLSDACDVSVLERPLDGNDHYYFLLTNNGFAFGQDWMCSVDFAPDAEKEIVIIEPAEQEDIVPSSSADSREQIEDSLRPYFENVSLDIIMRRQQAYEYIKAYTALLESFDGEVISSVSPCLPGNRLDITQPLLTVTAPNEYEHRTFHRWTGVDADYRIIATDGEYAYVVDAVLQYGEYNLTVPALFILSYERERISDDAYAFIHGRLLTFAELEQYKVFEGEGKVSYEISALIYDDPAEYLRAVDGQDGKTDLDETATTEFTKIREYYLEHLGELISYRMPE